MRIFKTLSEAYREVERELKHNGLVYQTETVQDKSVGENDEFKTKELQNYGFTVLEVKPANLEEFIGQMKLNSRWIGLEFVERVSNQSENPGSAYKERGVWNEFLHNGKFSYTYSERIGNQVDKVIELLRTFPSSRQGLINIYDKNLDHDNRGGIARVPCSLHYHVMIRNGQVDLTYVMRSCDFGEHFMYDMVLACLLQNFIAERLKLPTGHFGYFTHSLHTFYKDNKEIF